MSLSKPQLKNPAARFIQWRGGAENVGTKDEQKWEGGKLTWYDKEAQEENEIALPFNFVVLDELTTLTGFNEGQMSGYWSNEVRDSNGILVARTKQGIQARGTYQQIKEKGLSGLKYAQSVYIAFKDESGELVIGNIKMAGAAMSAWIDFKKRFDVSQCAVQITDEPQQAKKGKNVYFVPVFEGVNLNENTKAEAVKLDEELQRYLNTYMQQKPDEDDADVTTEDDEPTTDIHNIAGVDDKPAPAEPAAPADEPQVEPPKEEAPAAEKPKEGTKLKDVQF